MHGKRDRRDQEARSPGWWDTREKSTKKIHKLHNILQPKSAKRYLPHGWSSQKPKFLKERIELNLKGVRGFKPHPPPKKKTKTKTSVGGSMDIFF